jgi:hypothetical protein
MRGVNASGAFVASGAATKSRMSRIRPQEPSLRSSPAPSVARSRVVDSEVAPQWSALVARRRLP